VSRLGVFLIFRYKCLQIAERIAIFIAQNVADDMGTRMYNIYSIIILLRFIFFVNSYISFKGKYQFGFENSFRTEVEIKLEQILAKILKTFKIFA